MAAIKDLSGQAAVVTGGARGIGKSVCEALLAKKVKVCIADVLTEKGLETLKECQMKYGSDSVIFHKCDVTSEQEFEDTLIATKKAFGRLDILINNAGILGEKNWKKTLDVNLGGVIQGTYLAFRHLEDGSGKKGGVVINTASVAGFSPSVVMPVYAASKHGVVGFTKCWGDPFNVNKTGVKVNAVCPGCVTSPLQQLLVECPEEVCTDTAEAKNHYDIAISRAITSEVTAEAYIKILEEDVSGKLLVVSLEKGMDYVPYENYQ